MACIRTCLINTIRSQPNDFRIDIIAHRPGDRTVPVQDEIYGWVGLFIPPPFDPHFSWCCCSIQELRCALPARWRANLDAWNKELYFGARYRDVRLWR